MSILELIGLIIVVTFIFIFICWIFWVTCKLYDLEKRLDNQNIINEKFKLKKEYKEDYDD